MLSLNANNIMLMVGIPTFIISFVLSIYMFAKKKVSKEMQIVIGMLLVFLCILSVPLVLYGINGG